MAGGLMDTVMDFAAENVDPNWFPTSARTFLETVRGDRSPITEKNFSKDELAIIKDLAEMAGDRGYVDYPDYIKLAKKKQMEGKGLSYSVTPSMLSMGDALGNVQTTLGRFGYKREGDRLVATDKYDFNPVSDGSAEAASAGVMGPYGMIRAYAGRKVPPGQGREVRVETEWDKRLRDAVLDYRKSQ
jgi:hypothetical protein